MIPPDIHIPDRELYQPRFSPWLGGGEFGAVLERIKPHTLVSEASCYTLYTLARQAARLPGEIWECGVLRGGSAILLAEALANEPPPDGFGPGKTRLRLFDTFGEATSGTADFDERYDVPYPKRDRRDPEELADSTLERVRQRLAGYPDVSFHPGRVPETFRDLEPTRVALAHVDVNLYRAVRACCELIYERMVPGGFLLFDDYGYASCPGARRAVDEFFRLKPEVPLVLPTAQALVVKLPPAAEG